MVCLMKNDKETLNDFLKEVKQQIVSFDTKATALLAVVGIVFAILTDLLNVFKAKEFLECANICIKRSYLIIFCFYCFFAFIAIVCNILVLVPRITPKKLKDSKKHINYYFDVASLSLEDFDLAFENYLNDDEVVKKQLINNSIICKRKHIFLILGIVFLGLFIILSFVLIGLFISL